MHIERSGIFLRSLTSEDGSEGRASDICFIYSMSELKTEVFYISFYNTFYMNVFIYNLIRNFGKEGLK